MIVDILCIKKLLMTNNFSEIFLDQTKENILKLLGNPIDSSPQRKNNKEILSYCVLQIYVFNSLVKGFTFDYQKEKYFDVDFTLLKIHQDEIVKFLMTTGIEYVEDIQLSFQVGTILKVNKVYLGFTDGFLTIFGMCE
ncbi:hypothetical protein ABFO63_03180 [Acinetobacter junii]|uniref:hypothetical protein n=1 Tax=Acinetobacter junii TaxID=40215 RepID=UPI003213BEFA